MGIPGASLVSAPWGGGARGSPEPAGQKKGTGVPGRQLGPLRREEILLSSPQNLSSKYPFACLVTAANHSTS